MLLGCEVARSLSTVWFNSIRAGEFSAHSGNLQSIVFTPSGIFGSDE